MTFIRAIVTVLATTFLFAGIGTGLGLALGHFTPEYYRSIFRQGHEPGFDPLSVGLGQGLTQGTAAGAIIGLALVALLCWLEVRSQRANEVAPTTRTEGATTRRLLVVAGGLLLLFVCSGIAMLLGVIFAEREAYHRRYLEERLELAPVLASDPAFSGIQLSERSNGGVNMLGKVSGPEDLDKLHSAVKRAVGETRARQIISGVRMGE